MAEKKEEQRYTLAKGDLEITTSLLRERNELIAQGFREKEADDKPAGKKPSK